MELSEIKSVNDYKEKISILFNTYKNTRKSECNQNASNIFIFNFILNFYEFRKNNDQFEDNKLFFELNKPNINDIEKYLNQEAKTLLFSNDIVNYNIYKTCTQQIIEWMSELASICNIKVGNTIAIHQLLNLYKTDDEFRHLLTNSIDLTKKQVSEIENCISDRLNTMLFKLRTTDKCGTFSNMLNCGSAISDKQLGQLINIIGFKPDINGITIPKPINTSFLRGIDDIQDWVNTLKGARKASIINFSQVRTSGYLARKLIISAMDTLLDTSIDECDTKFTIPFKIESKEHLKRLNGRYHSEGVINADDEKMVEQEIRLYSPITCASKLGVCPRCYGLLHKTNKEFNIGIVAQLNLSEQMTQRLLSAKHLLQTNSKKIVINSDILFLNQNELFLKDGSTIVIDGNSMTEDDFGNVTINKVINAITKKGIIFEDPLFINKHLIEEVGEHILVKADGEDKFIGHFEVINNELNASLMKIIELIERKNSHTPISMFNEFVNLLLTSKMSSDFIHIETTIRNFIRSKDDIYSRPDFSDPELDINDMTKIQILTLDQSNIYSALATSLIYEDQKKQLLSPNVFKRKGESIIDGLFIK